MLVLVASLTLGCEDRWKKCHENGGRVERYNCHTTTLWQSQYDANGNLIGMYPIDLTNCDERCVGASAEARP